jgi:uncharacterized integral membrane protein
MQILLIFSLLIAILAVGFAVQNAGQVSLHFAVWKTEVPLAFALIGAMLIGAVISLLVSTPSLTRARLNLRKQKKRLADLETNLASQTLKTEAAEKRVLDLETKLAEKNQLPADKPAASPEKPQNPTSVQPLKD